MKNQIINYTEREECVLLVDYLNLLKMQGKVMLFTHTAQETYTTSWSQKMKNKQMGVNKGFPDYVVITDGFTLFLEMKRKRGGTVSPEQKEWHEALAKTGQRVMVCRGFDEAKEFIDLHIAMRRFFKKRRCNGNNH